MPKKYLRWACVMSPRLLHHHSYLRLCKFVYFLSALPCACVRVPYGGRGGGVLRPLLPGARRPCALAWLCVLLCRRCCCCWLLCGSCPAVVAKGWLWGLGPARARGCFCLLLRRPPAFAVPYTCCSYFGKCLYPPQRTGW